MNDFGAWVNTVRNERGCDVRSFGRLTHVDPSTISRIENGHTQATLYTAMRICHGLKIDRNTLIHALSGKNAPIITKEPKPETVLTSSDVERFLALFPQEYERGFAILVDFVNLINAKIESPLNPPAHPASIDISDLRFILKTPRPFRVDLPYPDLSANILLETYQAGGLLMLSDVGAYIRKLRWQHKGTLRMFKNESKRSTSVHSKLESGLVENIKLVDVFTLDEQLGRQSEIFMMYWDALEFHATLTGVFQIMDTQIEKVDLAYFLVILCRWMQLQSHGLDWLTSLR